MGRILYQFIFEYWKTSSLKTIFALVGIALGVALFLTTTLNGIRAENSLVDFSSGYFDAEFGVKVFSLDESHGITDQVVEKIYRNPRLRFIEKIIPRIQRVGFLRENNNTIQVVYQGIDTTKEGSSLAKKNKVPETNFLAKTFVSSGLSDKLNSKALKLEFSSKEILFEEYKTLDTKGGLFLLEDISVTKERFGENIPYSYLLLNANTDENSLKVLKEELKKIDSSLELETKDEIIKRASSALKSFHLNLVIISMISVLIAFFMVSNTMTAVFHSRKKEIGILRSIGVTPMESLILFLSQGLSLGILGTGLGIILGIYFSKLSFFIGESTVTDSDQSFSYTEFPNEVLLTGIAIGILGSFVSSLAPSIRSFNISPLIIIKDQVKPIKFFNPLILFIIGTISLLISFPISRIKTSFALPLFGLFAIGLIVFGGTLQFPAILKFFTYIAVKSFETIQKPMITFRIGLEELSANLIRNTLTGGTLMLAVSLVISLSILTESYKKSIGDWTDREFPYSYSIVNGKDIQNGTLVGIPTEIKSLVQKEVGITEVDSFILNTKLESGNKIYVLHSYDFNLAKRREINSEIKIHPSTDEKGILISSNMAFLSGWKVGEKINLPTKEGKKDFQIIGIKEHFFSENGTIMMDEKLYKENFKLNSYQAIRFNFQKEIGEKLVLEKINQILAKYPDLKILSSAEVKAIYLEGTERIFKVLDSLKYTACIIALISLFSSILYGLSDKMKNLALMNSIGAGVWDLVKVIFFENLFLIFSGSLAGILTSILLAPITLDVINRNAFGWTITKVYPIDLMMGFLVASPILAILGCIYPSFVLKNLSLRKVLSYE
ncbi:MAG: FtsX-like permease family protein [Leptospiraceae bacterium]|nr:FtsX-like permease family protein [Leptospiraceae bacterium]